MLKLFHAQLHEGLHPDQLGTNSARGAVLAFALLFLPSFLFVKLLARSIGRRTRRSVLGPVDRVLGGGFGMLKGLLGATLFFLLANLATDMVYGPRGRAARMDDASRGPIRCSTPAGARSSTGSRRGATPGRADEAMIRLHDTMTREKRPFVPAQSAAHHHVCVRADGLRPRPYRQCAAGGGVRHARPAASATNSARTASSMRATSPTSTTRSSPPPRRRASTRR